MLPRDIRYLPLNLGCLNCIESLMTFIKYWFRGWGIWWRSPVLSLQRSPVFLRLQQDFLFSFFLVIGGVWTEVSLLGTCSHTTMPTHAHTNLYILSKCQQSVTGSLIVFLYLISSGTGSQLNALCRVSLSCYTFWHDGLVYVIKKSRTAEKQLAERGRKYGVEQSLGQRGRVIDSDPRRDQYNATSSDTTYRVKFEPKRDWVMEWRYQFIQGIFLSMLFKQCSGDNSLSGEKAKELKTYSVHKLLCPASLHLWSTVQDKLLGHFTWNPILSVESCYLLSGLLSMLSSHSQSASLTNCNPFYRKWTYLALFWL